MDPRIKKMQADGNQVVRFCSPYFTNTKRIYQKYWKGKMISLLLSPLGVAPNNERYCFAALCIRSAKA